MDVKINSLLTNYFKERLVHFNGTVVNKIIFITMKVLFIIGSFGWSFPARVKALKKKLEEEGHSIIMMELFSSYNTYEKIPREQWIGLVRELLS